MGHEIDGLPGASWAELLVAVARPRCCLSMGGVVVGVVVVGGGWGLKIEVVSP